jgi:hypothetical protein
MQRIAISAAACGVLLFWSLPGATAHDRAGARASGTAVEFSAQSRPRARPRLRVTPRYRCRNFHTEYPPPYRYECPGPFAKRHCVARYVREFRPSGPVVVPRMRCRWGPG